MNIKNIFKKRTSKLEELSNKLESLENRIFKKREDDDFFSPSLFYSLLDESPPLEEEIARNIEATNACLDKIEKDIKAIKKHLNIKIIKTKSEIIAVKKVKKINK